MPNFLILTARTEAGNGTVPTSDDFDRKTDGIPTRKRCCGACHLVVLVRFTAKLKCSIKASTSSALPPRKVNETMEFFCRKTSVDCHIGGFESRVKSQRTRVFVPTSIS